MMNGSRSSKPRHGDRPSLDAINRTIEGLESRIDDLISSTSLGARQNQHADAGHSSQLSEIFDRQKVIDQNRQGQMSVSPHAKLADQIRERLRATGPAPQARPATTLRAARTQEASVQPSGGAFDIAEALVNLRKDLKHDLSQSFGREIADLRKEMRSIGGMASEQEFATEIHADLQRLASGIERLSQTSDNSAVRNLQTEFDSLRSLIGGLASHEDVHAIAMNIPAQTGARLDGDALREEILHLAARIDDLKAQLHGFSAVPALQAVEAKLVTIAEAIEMFAEQGRDESTNIGPQIAALGRRLDEIATATGSSAHLSDHDGDAGLSGLEERITRLAGQVDEIAIPRFENDIGARIEGLTQRIEDLGYSQTAARLEQRLDELAEMMDHIPQPRQQPELSGFLSDISRKIDALDGHTVSNELVERFDHLARRIDNLETTPAHFSDAHEEAFLRLEGRMQDIAQRLDQAARPSESHPVDLSALEEQITNLSALLNQQNGSTASDMSGVENRMAALEDYLATNDEYIVEAARQAAENAIEAYTRNFSGHASATGAGAQTADLSAISDLAADLRALEDLTRAGETRTQRTFEALQDTLVQIAERLDRLGEPAAATAAAQAPASPAAAFGNTPPMPAATYEPQPFGENATAYHDEYKPAAAVAELENDVEDTQIGHERDDENRSLFASLGKKLTPGRREPKEKPPRQMIEPSPAIDAADDISPELANQLLEPGSGAPDIRKILETVRASKSAHGDDVENGDYIAAARRAAQAAAAEMTPDPSGEGKTPKGEGMARYRRPLLLAVGAVLLAVMAYPLARNFIDGSPASVNEKPAAITNTDKQAATPSKAPAATAPSKQATQAPASNSAANAGQSAAVTPAEKEVPPETAKAEDTAGKASVQAKDNGGAAPAQPASSDLAVPAGISPPALVTAAQQNDPLALYEIGMRLSEGRGVPPNASAAVAWYEKAAKLGFAPANFRLGSIYEKGIGAKVDIAKAKAYYLSAAQAGNVSAMHNLAVLYATGTAGTPDFKSAAKWFTQAANHGVRDSQFNLAILYAKGSGVEQNLEKSYEWFGIAAKDGDNDAAQKRDEVGKVLTQQQLKDAKAAVDKWAVALPDQNANSTIIPDAWAGKGKTTSSIDMKKAIRNIQAILDKNGFDAGPPDGVMGSRTIAAIKSFQSSIGQKPTGKVDDALVRALLARNTKKGKS